MVNRITPHFFIRGYSTRPPSIRKLLASPSIGDGSCSQSLQVVATSSILPKELNFHSCVMVDGELRPSDHPKQEFELVAKEVHLLRACDANYPFQPRQAASQEHVRGQPTCKLPAKNMSEV